MMKIKKIKKKFNREFFKKEVFTPLTSPIKKYKIISFDMETHGKDNLPLICGIMSDVGKRKNVYKHFHTIQDAQDYIESIADKNTYVIATNLGFDFQGLYYNTKQWSKFKLVMKGGNTITATYKNIHYTDTANYIGTSLKNLGKSVDIEKLPYKKMMSKVPRNRRQWKNLYEYNKRDCLITKVWTEKFQEVLNHLGCELKVTKASCALDLYKRKYLKQKIFKEHCDVKDFIYDGYYGGRTEAFKRGKLNLYWNKIYNWYDYNSAYPFQMLKEYPLPSSAKLTENSSIALIKKYHGTSDVEIECPYMKYPLLPYKMKISSKTNKLIFPIGKWRGTFNHIELQRALELGYKINNIYKTVYYTQTIFPFIDYVKDLYTLRMKYKKENNTLYTEVVKSLLTNLYGKFATRHLQDTKFYNLETMSENEKSKLENDSTFELTQVTKIVKGRVVEGYQDNNKECEQNYVLPIWSSCVTSYQRVALHKDLVKLNGLYCDTDSILTEKTIQDNYDLGGLKLEKQVTQGWIIKPKLYEIYDKTLGKDGKPKGWGEKAKGLKGVNQESFRDILDGKKVRQVKFMKVKEALKRGYRPNKRLIFYKTQDLEDDKRDWKGQKFNEFELQDSEPIHINDT